MVLDINLDHIAQEPKLHDVEYPLVRVILQFAVLGSLDTARQLISLLHPTALHTWAITLRPLNLAWEATGIWPDGIADKEKTQESLAQIKKDYSCHWPRHVELDDRTTDANGAKRALDLPERDKMHADATTGSAAMEKSIALVKALEIYFELSEDGTERRCKKVKAAQDLKPAGSTRSKTKVFPNADCQDIFEQIVGHIDANDQIDCLARSSALWPLLIGGALARALDISEAELESKAQDILGVFTERIQQGRKRPSWLDGAIPDLLEICNNNTLNNTKAFYKEYDWIEAPESLYQDPANEEEIAAAERELDTKLPADFKEFLATTNGFERIWNGVLLRPPLHDTGKLTWIDTKEHDYFKLEVDLLDLPGSIRQAHRQYDESGNDKPLMPEIDRVIEIGQEDVYSIWLAPPALIHRVKERHTSIYEVSTSEDKERIDKLIREFAGSQENFRDDVDWCVLCWEDDFMYSFSSFRAYLEDAAWRSGRVESI